MKKLLKNKKLIIIVVVVVLFIIIIASKKSTDADADGGGNSGTDAGTGADDATLKTLLESFIVTCNDYGNAATAASHPWDTKTLKEIMALPTNDLVRLNSMFKAAAACTYSDNYGAVKSKYYTRTSLSDAIPAGTRCKYRTGASTAFAFKEKMEALGL
ncbi:MAG: hypothetical protein ACI3ZV_01725 [Paludibacteraceae bacterium]